MSAKKDVVYVDVDDEITTIIDKVQSAKQKIVALVLPKRAATLQSIVNMRLLKRSASSDGKNVVLITSESALLPLAGAAGLHVAKNLQSVPEVPPSPRAEDLHPNMPELGDVDESETPVDQSPKLDYNKPVGELARGRDEPEEIALDDEDAAATAAKAEPVPKKEHKAKGTKVPNFDRFRLLLFGGIALLIILIGFFIFASTVLPKATITVTTTSTPVSLNTNLTASGSAKTLDEAQKIIPSVLKTSDQSTNQTATATGQQNLGQKAAGSITMTAQACAPNLGTPNPVSSGTGVSSNGISFITQADAQFSFAGISSGSCANYKSGTVSITAQAPGTKYNVNNASFTVPGRSDVSASGSATGGTDNNVTILQQSDVDGASSKISSTDAANFTKSFEDQLTSQGYYVFTSTLQAAAPVVTSNPAVGAQASTATVTTKITYSVLVVQKSDLTTYVTDALNKQIDPSKEKLSDNNILGGLNISVQNQNQADATLTLSKDSTAVPILDDQTIAAQSAGKKSGDIQTYINTYPGVKNVSVKFSPFWVSKAPKNTAKIKIVQDQLKSGS